MPGPPLRLGLILLALIALSLVTTQTRLHDTILHHVPTLAFLGLMAWHGARTPLSDGAYRLLFLFLLLHVFGSHWTYSFVPYDDWAQRLFGMSLSEAAGFRRNHFDRVVHFLYGLLLMRPATEMSAQWLRVGGTRALAAAFLVLSFGSLAYELLEWGIAVTMSPETAENYNGQQGDVWDAQKDMALAFVGSLLGGAWTAWTGWRVPGRS